MAGHAGAVVLSPRYGPKADQFNRLERFGTEPDGRFRSSVFRADANDDVYATDFGSRRRQRQFCDSQIVTRNILKPASRLAEEVMMISGIGVEIRPARFHDNFMQQPRIGELVQSIVDRRQGYPDARGRSFAVQLLGSDVAVAILEQQARQSDALARRPQICRAEAFESGCCSGRHLHATNIGGFMAKPTCNNATDGCRTARRSTKTRTAQKHACSIDDATLGRNAGSAGSARFPTLIRGRRQSRKRGRLIYGRRVDPPRGGRSLV
jgi:hypothetical protein